MATLQQATRFGMVLALLASASTHALDFRSEGPELGVVNDVVYDPTQPGVAYAAISNSGIWRSDDGGVSWRRLNTGEPGGAFEWVEPDHGDAKTLWSGGRPSGQSALYRSQDGGATWHVVTGPAKGELGRLHSTGARIAFAPSDAKAIFVPSTNLHYRSNDGGASWTSFRVPGQDAYAIAIDPTNPKRVYAGGRGQAHHISVSVDGGVTWRAIGTGLPEKSFDQLLIHPQRASTLFGLIGFNEVWMSTDAGATFAPLPKVVGMAATDDARLVLDPTNPDVLWLVGEGGIYRGDVAGNWEEREDGTGSWRARSLAVDPRDGNRMLAGMAGDGVYRSEDGGASWQPSRQGLHAARVERIYAAPGRGELWAQTSAGLFRQVSQGGWEEVREPFSRGRAAEPKGMVFDRSGGVVAFDGRDFWRATDGGAGWKVAMKPIKDPSISQMMKGIVELPRPDFRAVVQDPADAKRWFGGGDRDEPGEAVFASRDGGQTWQPSGKGLSGRVDALLSPQSGVLLAMTEDRALHRSADGGGSWSSAAGGWPAAELRGWVSDAEGRVFAATEQGLYRSDEGGQSWARKANGLSDSDLAAVAVSPSGSVLVASDSGVFVSRDEGETFTKLDEPRLRFAQALAFGGEPARLYVGTAALGVLSAAWVE